MIFVVGELHASVSHRLYLGAPHQGQINCNFGRPKIQIRASPCWASNRAIEPRCVATSTHRRAPEVRGAHSGVSPIATEAARQDAQMQAEPLARRYLFSSTAFLGGTNERVFPPAPSGTRRRRLGRSLMYSVTINPGWFPRDSALTERHCAKGPLEHRTRPAIEFGGSASMCEGAQRSREVQRREAHLVLSSPAGQHRSRA